MLCLANDNQKLIFNIFRFTELLDSVLHYLLPSWHYSAGSFKDLEVKYKLAMHILYLGDSNQWWYTREGSIVRLVIYQIGCKCKFGGYRLKLSCCHQLVTSSLPILIHNLTCEIAINHQFFIFLTPGTGNSPASSLVKAQDNAD